MIPTARIFPAGASFLALLVTWRIFARFRNKRRTKKMFAGKTVLITGASSGIGLELAQKLADFGAKVILAARSTQKLERIATDLKSLGKSAEAVHLDLSDLESLGEFSHKILENYGPIDILINNAGVGCYGFSKDMKIDLIAEVMRLNFLAQVALTNNFLPSMIARKSGLIVLISSLQGKFTIPFQAAYGASKHALQGYFDSLRAEIADTGVKICVISPGYVQTEIAANALTATGDRANDRNANNDNGLPVEKFVAIALSGIANGKKELLIGGGPGLASYPYLVLFVRHFWPSFYFWSMQRRAAFYAAKYS